LISLAPAFEPLEDAYVVKRDASFSHSPKAGQAVRFSTQHDTDSSGRGRVDSSVIRLDVPAKSSGRVDMDISDDAVSSPSGTASPSSGLGLSMAAAVRRSRSKTDGYSSPREKTWPAARSSMAGSIPYMINSPKADKSK